MSNGRVEISKGKSGKVQKLKKNIHANNFACFVLLPMIHTITIIITITLQLSNISLRFTVALPLIFACVILFIFCCNNLTERSLSL